MAGGDQEMARKKLGTTVEELKMCGTDVKAGSHGVQGLSKAGRYPVVLAGVAVVTGIGAAMYYKSLNDHEPERDAKGEVEAVLDSVPIPDAPADAAAA